MKFNEKDLVNIAHGVAQYEGRMEHRAPPSFRDTGFRERYFKLIGNLLFYFRFTEWGTVETKEPAGVLVLENYSVQPEYEETDVSFSFSILFLDEPDKKHVFCCRTDSDVQKWVNALQRASYQHWKEKLSSMQNHIEALREARKSPYMFHSERWRTPRPNPFSLSPVPSPQLPPRRVHSSSSLTPTPPLLPAPPVPPRPRPRRLTPTPSQNNLAKSNEVADDLIKF
ncbi:unnamed protein product [Orchesella dallaii]|uniref:Pleckstrin homology domain-containing family J member 1 n=1 Tax=Orchesella dallaii TaxID=48710 RepID=A0ABP1QQ67_9HEXA